MKKLAFLVLFVQTIYAIPVYEFFGKGSVEYYQANTKNILDFFDKKLVIPTTDVSRILFHCQTQFSEFGFNILTGVKVNVLAIKVNLDQLPHKEVSFYCKVDPKISGQLVKMKKPPLTVGEYYHFKWDLLNSRLNIYSIKKEAPKVLPNRETISFDKLLPVHLLNIENGNIIYFGLLTDRQKKAQVHTMLDINYPIIYDPEMNIVEFSVIEINPLFFPTKTRGLFKEFNSQFGIIPDRMILKNRQPVAVMP